MPGQVTYIRAAQDEREEDERYLQHVVRYLKTLVLPLTASKRFQSTAKAMTKVPLRAYLAEMDPGPLDFTLDYVQNFRTKFSRIFVKDVGKAQKFFEGKAMKPDVMNEYGTVHAEAAMMGLAWAARDGGTIEGVDPQLLSSLRNDIFQVRLSRVICDACTDVDLGAESSYRH